MSLQKFSPGSHLSLLTGCLLCVLATEYIIHTVYTSSQSKGSFIGFCLHLKRRADLGLQRPCPFLWSYFLLLLLVMFCVHLLSSNLTLPMINPDSSTWNALFPTSLLPPHNHGFLLVCHSDFSSSICFSETPDLSV